MGEAGRLLMERGRRTQAEKAAQEEERRPSEVEGPLRLQRCLRSIPEFIVSVPDMIGADQAGQLSTGGHQGMEPHFYRLHTHSTPRSSRPWIALQASCSSAGLT